MAPWALASVRPAAASVTTVNTSCSGSAGYVAIRVVDDVLPWLGDPLRIELSSLPWLRGAVFLFGASNEMLGSVRLPLDLGSIGMPGCPLGVAPLVSMTRISFLGLGSVDVSVPHDPLLVGSWLYVQGLAEDPGANPFGATTSTLPSGPTVSFNICSRSSSVNSGCLPGLRMAPITTRSNRREAISMMSTCPLCSGSNDPGKSAVRTESPKWRR